MRSAFLALRSRFMSGHKRFAASSATTSAKVFASMWWKSVLFCLIAFGPTSSKCDLTLMTSVKPLRTSINWKRIDHKSPFGPCSNSPVFHTFHHIIRIYRNLDVRLFVDSAGGLGCLRLVEPSVCLALGLPKKPMRCSLKHASLSICIEKVASPHATCLRVLGVSLLPPDPSEATSKLLLAHSLKPLLSHILASVHSARSFAGNQSRGNKPWANKT